MVLALLAVWWNAAEWVGVQPQEATLSPEAQSRVMEALHQHGQRLERQRTLLLEDMRHVELPIRLHAIDAYPRLMHEPYFLKTPALASKPPLELALALGDPDRLVQLRAGHAYWMVCALPPSGADAVYRYRESRGLGGVPDDLAALVHVVETGPEDEALERFLIQAFVRRGPEAIVVLPALRGLAGDRPETAILGPLPFVSQASPSRTSAERGRRIVRILEDHHTPARRR
jgi:hypothetical protein